MDTKVKNKMLKFLTAVVAGDLSVLENNRYGICFNLSEYVGLDDDYCGYDLVEDYGHEWEHFSGDYTFPVKESNNLTPKWECNQLVLRQSLCEHLLTVLGNLKQETE
jgi:hypothetical protein